MMRTTIPTSVSQRMAAVREAFRQHRMARVHRRLWLFYVEHNLFDQADDCREQVLVHLRAASRQWRVTLE